MRDLDTITASIAADTARRTKALTQGVSAPPTPEANLQLAFTPGARVFDLVTGQEGIVNAGSKADYLIHPASK
jgi:hypothetical protein